MRVEPGNLTEKLADLETTEYQIYARTSGDWLSLFHISDNRANVVQWIHVFPGKSALEIGAQAGAISAVIANKYDRYVALDISEDMKRAFECRKDKSGIEYIVSDVAGYASQNKESFDDIYLVGGLSEACKYCNDANASAYLSLIKRIKSMLKPNGRLILASENRFGLKYWAGNVDESTGEFFTGLEGYPNGEVGRAFSKKELGDLLKEGGFNQCQWYYPYPDLYFTNMVFSDAYLPKPGDLIQNNANYKDDRVVLFNESNVYNSLVEEEMYPFFANSYLVIASKGESKPESTVFTKYSKERDASFAIRTDLIQCNGKLYARKNALYPNGVKHVESIYKKYDDLAKVYEPEGIYLNQYTKVDDELLFEFVRGKNLQSMIEELIQSGHEDEAEELFDRYVHKCFLDLNTVEFTSTEEFQSIYGPIEVPENTRALEKSDTDLICSNIFVEKDGTGEKWNVIDYEWSANFPIPVNFLMYRSFALANVQMKECEFLKLENLMRKYNISKEEWDRYVKMEENFQRHVRKGMSSDAEVVERMHRSNDSLADWKNLKEECSALRKENQRLEEEHARQNKYRTLGFRWIKRLGRR